VLPINASNDVWEVPSIVEAEGYFFPAVSEVGQTRTSEEYSSMMAWHTSGGQHSSSSVPHPPNTPEKPKKAKWCRILDIEDPK